MDDSEMIDIEEHLQRSIGSEEVGMPTEKWVAVLEEMRQLRKENKALRGTKREWIGLTDVNEMVEAELTHYWNGEYELTTGARNHLTDFAQAIEAKLKEKNGG